MNQIFQLIKQNKLYSGVYILGTAMAISLVMAYSIMWYVKMGPVYPEFNRDKVLYISTLTESEGKNGNSISSISLKCIETILPKEDYGKEVEAVAVFAKESGEWSPAKIYSATAPGGIKGDVFYTNEDLCKVFDYEFLYGAPFTKEDVVSGAKRVFISVNMARNLFGKENAVGEQLKMDKIEYTVCGVIKNVSALTIHSYGDLWIPISHHPEYVKTSFGSTGMLGPFNAIILARKTGDLPIIKERIELRINRLNQTLKGVEIKNFGQPDTHFASYYRVGTNAFPDISAQILQIIFIVLALMVVPAINLSGVIAVSIEGRREELGIRKSFGATKGRLFMQILRENLVLTIFGGVVGLILSWGIVLGASKWLLVIVNGGMNSISYSQTILDITPQMLFNPWIFCIAFIGCLIMNLMATCIPAYMMLRQNVINSLMEDRK